MESIESMVLKQQAKEKLRKSLIENEKFDEDTTDEIVRVFDIAATG